MNVLLLGSGGREFTFAWKFKQSPLLTKLFIAPGNGGTDQFGVNLELNPEDFLEVKSAIIEHKIDLVVIGPEGPLVAGIKDQIKADENLKSVLVLGPDKLAATLEGSKDFAKKFMVKYGIPTAAHKTFTAETLEQGYQFLETLAAPYVLKADGLAAGKGVLIIKDLSEAKQELNVMLTESKFGQASETVVIEEFLEGVELSIFTLTDGNNYVVLPEAKDYKRIHDGDIGLNTGGMGAVSPVPFAQGEFLEKVNEQIIKPEGYDYSGFVFFGLINRAGEPYVIEYNVRMGDPETEVVLPRIDEDLLKLCADAAAGKLESRPLNLLSQTALTVMLVSGGYPESYEKGKEINGLETIKDGLLIHAGTKNENKQVLTSGGRVISCTAFGNSLEGAQKKAYQMASLISFQKKFYRKDIGNDLM
jgi:phosphoribosylamine--glycine ligase